MIMMMLLEHHQVTQTFFVKSIRNREREEYIFDDDLIRIEFSISANQNGFS